MKSTESHVTFPRHIPVFDALYDFPVLYELITKCTTDIHHGFFEITKI